MNQQRIFGIVLLVAGLVILAMGVHASHSVADQVSDTFTGRFTKETMVYLICGGAAAFFGLILALQFRGKNRLS